VPGEIDTDARLWHPWLRINRVLRVQLDPEAIFSAEDLRALAAIRESTARMLEGGSA
jgi:hypothetical protein